MIGVPTSLDHIECVLESIEISLGDLGSCRSSKMGQIRALSAAAEVRPPGISPLRWDIEQGHEQIESQKQDRRESNTATGKKRDPRASVAQGRWYLPQLRLAVEILKTHEQIEIQRPGTRPNRNMVVRPRHPDSGSCPSQQIADSDPIATRVRATNE